MVKKVFALALGLIVAVGMMAQSAPKSVTINQSDIQFWVGTGSNSTVIAIGWDDDDASYIPTVVVWGIHWTGNITLLNALDTLEAYDSRFSYTFSGSYLQSLSYVDPSAGVSLTPSMGFNCNNYNGAYGSTNLGATWLRISVSTCDNYNFTGVNNLIYASDPNAGSSLPDTVDASLPFSEILYWVGSGTDSAEFIVNFAQPDTAFAWGYLFNGTTTAQAMIDAIAAADPRFWTVGTPSTSGDIHFVTDNGDTLGLSPVDPSMGYNFWWTNRNGVSAGSGTAVTLQNGDVFKYGDMNSATGWDYMYGYYMEEAWNTIPTPVTEPQTTPDTTAISADDILYWVGSGNQEAIFVLMDGNNARAWGYRFDAADEPTAMDMAVDIDAADPRLVYTMDYTTYELMFSYKEHLITMSVPDSRFSVDGEMAEVGDMLSDYDLYDGSIVIVSSISGDNWNTPIVPATEMHMPVNSTIAPADILYWVGEGVNEAVVVVNWGVPDTALAWGLRFTGATTIADAIDSIANADPRVTTDATHSTINYTDGNVSLSFQPAPASYMQFILDGNSNVNAGTLLGDGNQLKIGESAYGVGYDSIEYGGMWFPMGVVWNTEIHPVTVPGTTPGDTTETPVDATIAASDILFWVGHGENEAILAVNWADTALAWGYRFSADSVSSATMLADIAAADPRLTVDGAGMVSDIRYIDTAAGMTDTLAITSGNWWSSLLNGYSDMGTGQVLRNGDLQKWGDPAAGVIVDSMEWDGYWYYSYVYPMTIHPVTVPDTTGTVGPINPEHGPFCGAVGTEGCTAIKADSSAIVAWATGVTITRGPRTIANPDGSLASFGDETNAIGPATMDNTMDAVSLGDGGSALVTFAHSIRNGEGPDFAVYENAFGDGSLELAFVEVSSDGQRFVRFPATCLTQTETQLGNAGQTDPTNINNLAGKFRIGYGTPFDLDELADSTGINIDSIVYVRIVDVVGSIDPQYGTYDAFGHIINDPWPTPFEASGYDLTGVAVLHQNGNVGIDDVVIVEGLWPNPTADRVNVSLGRAAEGVLFDQTGRMVAAYSLTQGLNTLDLSALAHGVYILRVDGTATKIVKR